MMNMLCGCDFHYSTQIRRQGIGANYYTIFLFVLPLDYWKLRSSPEQGVGLGQVIFHCQADLPQQSDSRWQIPCLMIEIWQNNTVFYNSVPKQKYGSRKLNSALSPPCQSQRFSIKGQIIVFCLPPSQLTAEVTAPSCCLDIEKYLYWQGHKSHADKF